MKKNLNVTSVTLFLFLATSIITTNCGSIIKAQRNANTSITKLSLDTNVESDIGKGDFSIIRFCGDSLFLSLKQTKNTPVTILNTWQNKAVKAQVLETYKSTKLGSCVLGMYSWPDSVSYVGKFQNAHYFDVALLSEKNVQFIESKIINNKKLINRIDSIIQSNKRIKDTMSYSKYCYKINNRKLESFDLNNKIYYIYSYTNESKNGSTKLLKFIIYNNIISPISFACSFNSIIFRLNNSQLLIGQWEGQCCTDQNNLILYELKENGPVLKYNGDHWEGSESNLDYINDLPPMPPMPEKGE